MYSDEAVAELYDVLNPWGWDNDFYLSMVMNARAVLDVGCGTGALLHRARRDGHTGRLTGVDPDEAMLSVARRHDDIEWVSGTAASMKWDGEFELATMTGNAFQCLVTDDDVRDSLAAIHHSLASGGRFAFETRNLAARGWEQWTPENTLAKVVDPAGRGIRVWNDVVAVNGAVVSTTETTADSDGTPLRVDHGDLRFFDPDTLTGFLTGAGFDIDAQYRNFKGEPVTDTGKVIVTVAKRR